MENERKSDCLLKNRMSDDALRYITGGSSMDVVGAVVGAVVGNNIGRVVGATGGFLFGPRSHGVLQFFLDSFENIYKGAQIGSVVGTLSGAIIGAYNATEIAITNEDDDKQNQSIS